ncbi:MAG: STAS/SEC14 domain-containing protein [Gemmatimonadaceae bacterium]
MIGIEFSAPNVVTLTPAGALSAEDFARLTSTIDQYINENERAPNLVIHVGKLPHWDSFLSFRKHLRFVRNHEPLVKKVAIVGDNFAVRTLPLLMDLFVSAKVRPFSEARFAEAQQWAGTVEDHPGEFELLEGFPKDVIAIRARGIITGQDYREMLVPLVEERLKSLGRLKLLFVLDETFDSYSAAAAWDDARFGLSHLRDFGKIAVVTDIGWIRHGAGIFAPLMKADLRIFDVAELEEAKSWILRS